MLASEQGKQLRLTTVTAAPPGVTAILRWITVECLDGASRDVALALEFRGRAMQHDDQGFYFEYPHRNRVARLRPVMIGGEFKQDANQLSDESPSSYINLDAVLRPNDHVAAFARCVLVAERPQRLTFHLGADDGVVLWVGGRRVVERLGAPSPSVRTRSGNGGTPAR